MFNQTPNFNDLSKGCPLLDCIAVPLLIAQQCTGDILYLNSAGEELLGYTREELKNRTLPDMFAAASQESILSILNLMRPDRGDCEVKEQSLLLRKRNRRRIPVNVTAKSMIIDDEPVIIFSMLDISELKAYQEEREKAIKEMSHMSKLADIGRLAAGVAHELNNPLMIIQGFAENIENIIKDGQANPVEIQQQLDPILKSIDRMARVISQMMRMVRDDSVQLIDVDMCELVDDVLLLMENQLKVSDIEVHVDVPSNNLVKCDPNQIQQILINILNNAIHALEAVEEGRKVAIRLGHKDDQELALCVWNNGPEIPEHVKENVLSPFFTTKEVGEGTGLGLYVSYGIMKGHGGALDFTSSKKDGTEFILRFPTHENTEDLSTDECKVLVVDDEAFARKVLANKLQRYGCQVIQAQNGFEGLTKLGQNPDVVAVFTDIRMPKMDGKEFIKKIKDKSPSLNIYVVSGFAAGAKFEIEMRRLGVNDHFTKPLDNDRFNQVVRELITAVKSRNSQLAS